VSRQRTANRAYATTNQGSRTWTPTCGRGNARAGTCAQQSACRTTRQRIRTTTGQREGHQRYEPDCHFFHHADFSCQNYRSQS
jgi:hypothetical protein